MKKAILNALNIRKGEETAILLLLLYSFFMGSVIAFFYTAATSMFVMNFESSVLPYAYIGGGIMSYLVWLVYARIEARVNFQRLTFLGILLLLIAVGFFITGIHFFNSKWLPFLMFVWIRVFIFISVVGFWGLATKIFDLRQGKRIFGLISSGEVISDIVGFFSIPLVLHFIQTSDLLYISFFGILICLMLMGYMFRRFKEPLSLSDVKEEKKMNTSFKIVFKDKYLTILILMALLPMFGMCFADYSFLNQIKQEFNNQQFLASFLSIFFGATAVAEFILKSFFSGRLLNKYGLKVALPVVPVVLAGCVFLAIASGVFYGTTGLFFSFIAFTKMIDRVLRSAIYDPSYQILYQPLPSEDRLNAQGMVEGMAKGLGFALAGAVVLLFTQIKVLNLVHFNILFILILIVWVRLSLNMYKEYRHSLSKIFTSKEENTSNPIHQKSNINELSKIITEGKVTNITLILNVIFTIESQKIQRFLQLILASSSPGLKEDLLRQIRVRKIFSAEDPIRNLLSSNSGDTNKALCETTLNELRQVRNTDYEGLLVLSQSKAPADRALAANLLAYSSSYKIHRILQALLQDDDPGTRKAALISSGHIGKRELWPFIINNLFHPNYSTQAISAIRMVGEPILSELDNYFERNTTPRDVKLKIIAIYAHSRSEKALNLLRSRIHFPDETIRNHVFRALSKLEYRAKLNEVSRIKETIEDEIAITVWVMAALTDVQKEKSMHLLSEALQYELKQKKENVFLLLSMLYDSKTIRYIQQSFQSGTHESRVYATEILDLTVSSEIKEIFLPLLEDLSVEDSIRLFKDQYPQEKMTPPERLRDIINKDYLKINRWTKACAIIQLRNYTDNETILLSNILNPDPFIMQNSLWILEDQNSERFKVIFGKSDIDRKSFIQKFARQPEREIFNYSLSDKVELIKNHSLFASFSKPDIARIIENSSELLINAGDEINPSEIISDSILFIMSGKIEQYNNKLKLKQLTVNEIFWSILYDNEDQIILRGAEPSSLLILSPEVIYNTMTDNSEFTLEVVGILSKTA